MTAKSWITPASTGVSISVSCSYPSPTFIECVISNPIPHCRSSRFPEALHQQLGLRLDAETGLVNVLVIDHIEEPSTN
ncbi:MAG: hypothetical protein DMG30_24995 [Acidobacteria bacterium]|nr:MAG: hypothetical protein DMG30_24995 [Acidobacteriota bacterium]